MSEKEQPSCDDESKDQDQAAAANDQPAETSAQDQPSGSIDVDLPGTRRRTKPDNVQINDEIYPVIAERRDGEKIHDNPMKVTDYTKAKSKNTEGNKKSKK